MRRGILALESVEKPAAFHGILAGHGRWSGGFASSRDGEGIWNVQAKSRGVTVRGKVREGEPPGGEQQIGAVFADQRGTHTRHRTVLFIYQQA